MVVELPGLIFDVVASLVEVYICKMSALSAIDLAVSAKL